MTKVGWGFENLSPSSTRPTYMDVMDVVDEITIMDYFSGARMRAATGCPN